MDGVGGNEGAHEAGEGEFEEEEVRGALIAADFAQSDGAGSVAFGFSWGTGFGCWNLGGFVRFFNRYPMGRRVVDLFEGRHQDFASERNATQVVAEEIGFCA